MNKPIKVEFHHKNGEKVLFNAIQTSQTKVAKPIKVNMTIYEVLADMQKLIASTENNLVRGDLYTLYERLMDKI